VTAVLDHTNDTTVRTDQAVAALATWPARVGAFALDVLVGVGVVASLLLVAWSAPRMGWLWWVCVVVAASVLLAVAVNRLLLPAVTGWSLGRALFGIVVVQRDGVAVGPWRLLSRDAAHLFDTAALFIGWLWPLWDGRHRTFADLLVRTEVRVTARKPLRARRFAAIAMSAAAAVAVASTALGYVTVYRHDLRIAQSREQLAVQGPKLVTDMLSYTVATLQADFDRARGVVTDDYRPQLEAQQRAILDNAKKVKNGVVDNEYWATNAAVLTSTDTTGSMLVLLQGQRGEAPDLRTITATVKADFQRVRGQWKIAGLSVLAKPQPGGRGG
jgi:Mce-associated membrane protein